MTDLPALLSLLRAHGVTRYSTPELTLELGPAPMPSSGHEAPAIDDETLRAFRRIQSLQQGNGDV